MVLVATPIRAYLFGGATGSGADFVVAYFNAMGSKLLESVAITVLGVNLADKVISALIADEAAIGMVNSKTTAVRVIPAIGRKAGEILDFGGLLGYGPIMPVNQRDPSVFINRGGRLPAPMQSLKN